MDKTNFEYYSKELDKVDVPHRSRSELASLHRQVLAGDHAAWEALWLHGTKLVLKICFTLNKLNLLKITFEEAVSEGNLAIGEALTRWDPKRASFGTWVWIRVRGAILNENDKEDLRGMVGAKDEAPRVLTDEVQYESGTAHLSDHTAEDEDNLVEVEFDRLRVAVESLSEREKQVIIDLFYNDLDQVEVAQRAGVSDRMVRKVRDRALAKLKVELEGSGLPSLDG